MVMNTAGILRTLGLILLWVGLIYQVGGWRNAWTKLLKRPVFARVEVDPRYWWARPVIWLGAGLLLLSYWRSWEGV
jgi:hypothetical protein